MDRNDFFIEKYMFSWTISFHRVLIENFYLFNLAPCAVFKQWLVTNLIKEVYVVVFFSYNEYYSTGEKTKSFEIPVPGVSGSYVCVCVYI